MSKFDIKIEGVTKLILATMSSQTMTYNLPWKIEKFYIRYEKLNGWIIVVVGTFVSQQQLFVNTVLHFFFFFAKTVLLLKMYLYNIANIIITRVLFEVANCRNRGHIILKKNSPCVVWEVLRKNIRISGATLLTFATKIMNMTTNSLMAWCPFCYVNVYFPKIQSQMNRFILIESGFRESKEILRNTYIPNTARLWKSFQAISGMNC